MGVRQLTSVDVALILDHLIPCGACRAIVLAGQRTDEIAGVTAIAVGLDGTVHGCNPITIRTLCNLPAITMTLLGGVVMDEST